MPADFIQLARGYRSLEVLTSNCSITVFSKGEHLSSQRVIEAYSHKVLELLEEGGRKETSTASSIADFFEGRGYEIFAKEVNPKNVPEIIELDDKKHAYHFLPKSIYERFVLLEEAGLLGYKKIKNPHFDVASWVIKDNGRNSKRMRSIIEGSRIQFINGKFYSNCLIYEDLVSSLAHEFRLKQEDVERVQEKFSPAKLRPLCQLNLAYI